MGKYTNMTIEDVILRIREECDKLYEKYKGNSLIEEDDILDADKFKDKYVNMMKRFRENYEIYKKYTKDNDTEDSKQN